MDSFFVIALIVLALIGLVLLLLTWGAYTGKTRLLWIRGVRPLIGGRYWFVLTPAILVGAVLAAVAAVLVEANPEMAGTFADSPSDPLPATIILCLGAFLIVALVASYWLPESLKPRWVRELEAQETETDAARQQARRRG